VLWGGAGLLGTTLPLAHFLLRPGGSHQSVVAIVKRLFGADFASETVFNEFASFYVRTGYLSRRRDILMRFYASFFETASRLNVAPIADRIASIRQDVGEAFIRNTNMVYRREGEPITFEEEAMVPYACRNHLARFDDKD
jgi:hypothetical protein